MSASLRFGPARRGALPKEVLTCCFLGIDWSDASLDYLFSKTMTNKKLAQGSVKPDVAGLADLFSSVEAHARPGEIGVAIETCHGAWIQAFFGSRIPGLSRQSQHGRSFPKDAFRQW